MIRILLRALVLLGSSALGILAAGWLLEDSFRVSVSGFVVAVVVFTVAQSVLAPFIAKTAARYAPAFLGGIGLVSTFVALLLASLLSNGLAVSGVRTWILGTVVVWLVTALATLLLPLVLLRDRTRDDDAPRRPGQTPRPA
ncbi:MAG TPA: hypothetical protein VKZ83_13905 [Phototrophicaceae bacterium]|nr:hypothetical protein [Phototrophicaceae bacterium]